MNDTFQQSACQNFTRSPCQARNNSANVLLGLSASNGGQPPFVVGLRASQFGVINSVDLVNQSWNITMEFRPPQGGGYGVNGTSVNGFMCAGWIALIGPAVGTIGKHTVTAFVPGPNGNGLQMSGAISTTQVNGAPNGIAMFEPVTGLPGTNIWIWWPGRTPAQIPVDNIVWTYPPIPTQQGGNLFLWNMNV